MILAADVFKASTNRLCSLVLATGAAVKLIKSVFFPSLIKICLFLLSQNSCDISIKTGVLKTTQNKIKMIICCLLKVKVYFGFVMNIGYTRQNYFFM